MEYPTDMVTKVPEGTSSTKVDELRSAEAIRAAELISFLKIQLKQSYQ
jgi:hypothetical protein